MELPKYVVNVAEAQAVADALCPDSPRPWRDVEELLRPIGHEVHFDPYGRYEGDQPQG